MTLPKPSPFAKPSVNTRFFIDYHWWETQAPDDLRTYLLSHLSEEQRARLAQMPADHQADFIDPDTGEVTRLDALNMAMRTAAQQRGFISPQASLVDNVFRVFLSNNNQPLSPQELAPLVDRPADVILKTVGGVRIYKGIRPASDTPDA